MRQAIDCKAAIKALFEHMLDDATIARENKDRDRRDNAINSYMYRLGYLHGIEMAMDRVLSYIKRTEDKDLIRWIEDRYYRYREIHYGNQGT